MVGDKAIALARTIIGRVPRVFVFGHSQWGRRDRAERDSRYISSDPVLPHVGFLPNAATTPMAACFQGCFKKSSASNSNVVYASAPLIGKEMSAPKSKHQQTNHSEAAVPTRLAPAALRVS